MRRNCLWLIRPTIIAFRSELPRAAVLRHAGDQRQRHDEQRGYGGEQPGLGAAGVMGAGEYRRVDRDRDDGPDCHAHGP